MRDDVTAGCGQFDEAAWLLMSGELDGGARLEYERHLAGCDACAEGIAERRRVLDLYDGLAPVPGTRLDRPRRPGRDRPRASWKPALAAAAGVVLVLLGALAGRLGERPGADAAALRDVERRLAELTVQLAVARIDRPTAAERLKATTAGVALVDRDPRIVDSLLDVLETDPSPNVRMAAIDVLYRGGSTAALEDRFATLLAAQESPVLRIALIELAADRGLVKTLGEIRRVAAESDEEAVRARAEWAIGVLSRGA